MKKVDIIATLGPSLWTESELEEALKRGVTIFRINNSHMTESNLQQIFHSFQDLKDKDASFEVLFDTQGPEIRTGNLLQTMKVEEGQTLDFYLGEQQVSEKVPINYQKNLDFIAVDDLFFIDDGQLALKVVSVAENEFMANVIRGGKLSSKKGLNFPNRMIHQSILSANDREMLALIGKNKYVIDKLALSFVQGEQDIREARQYLMDISARPQIIAKIESKQAIERMEEIVNEADGVMVARGDLAVEIGLVKVPYFQKLVLQEARKWKKYPIVATQILSSMEHSPTPTRAEVSDATNALLEGAEALMLSGETAIGDYPMEAVTMLEDIISYYHMVGS